MTVASALQAPDVTFLKYPRTGTQRRLCRSVCLFSIVPDASKLFQSGNLRAPSEMHPLCLMVISLFPLIFPALLAFGCRIYGALEYGEVLLLM